MSASTAEIVKTLRGRKESGHGSGRPTPQRGPVFEDHVASRLRALADRLESGHVPWTDLGPFGVGLLTALCDCSPPSFINGKRLVVRAFRMAAAIPDGHAFNVWLDSALLADVIAGCRAAADWLEAQDAPVSGRIEREQAAPVSGAAPINSNRQAPLDVSPSTRLETDA